ncbi:MarR family transcriptional regulator [Hymenobacter sp. HMF4947]|uniref:MarR family transcriptional regulator n=1 Tax=Hymenobacter ginkgonis TaxID=2682976 RepID=A0A7K1TIV3_9BACT|nr:MarR family transcriptional regulator [Hymenobacter ginkgonis]MVN78256.1 MarR family transcriptional regulator [Hymenobacter ginkgonis]
MPTPPDSQHLAAELRTVVSRLIKKLRTHSPLHGTLSLTERSVIKLLDQHESLLPSELAAREKVTTQSMSQILSHLHELGYITRQPQATDKRKVRIGLTAAGQAILPTVRQELDDWLHRALQATCSAPELASLSQAVRVLEKIIDFD